jgi:hypothetical protein
MNNGVYGQIDNALPAQMFEKLQTQIMSPELAWFWTRTYASTTDPLEKFHNHWAHVITKEGGVKNSFLADTVEAALLIALDKSGQKLDQLFVSGKDQKSVLIKYLGWNKKRISVIPSLRFYKKSQKQFNGYIFTYTK